MIHGSITINGDGAGVAAQSKFHRWMRPGWMLVDIETTGLDPRRHSIIDFAAMNHTGARFSARFRARPGAELDPVALSVWGGSVRQLDSREMGFGYYEGIGRCAQWMKENCEERKITLCGLNPAGCDLPFLDAAFKELAWWERPWLSHRVIDLHDRACVYAEALDLPIPDGGFDTEGIYKLLQMEPEPRPHAAENGVTWEARAFARIYDTMRKLTTSGREDA